QGISIPTLRRHEPERDALWLALGRCYAAGVAIDSDALDPGDCAFVPLPAYPWQRERYWFSEDEGEVGASLSKRKHPLLGKRLATTDGIWKNRLDPALLSWLADHVVQDHGLAGNRIHRDGDLGGFVEPRLQWDRDRGLRD